MAVVATVVADLTIVVVVLLQGVPVVVVISVVVPPLSFWMMVDQDGLPLMMAEEVFVAILCIILLDLAHVENPSWLTSTCTANVISLFFVLLIRKLIL